MFRSSLLPCFRQQSVHREALVEVWSAKLTVKSGAKVIAAAKKCQGPARTISPTTDVKTRFEHHETPQANPGPKYSPIERVRIAGRISQLRTLLARDAGKDPLSGAAQADGLRPARATPSRCRPSAVHPHLISISIPEQSNMADVQERLKKLGASARIGMCRCDSSPSSVPPSRADRLTRTDRQGMSRRPHRNRSKP